MTTIRETFAKNLRERRRKCGFTQAQLSEKAGISTHYIALIELARNIPKVETIELLANALDVEIYELFIVPLSPAMELKKLNEAIVSDLKDAVKESIDEAITSDLKDIVKKSVDEAFAKERKRQKKCK
jgi:transcriptional regulator with XRE-family HTH domain